VAWVGAHNFHYFEACWGANPGLYQHFAYSINDAGYGAWDTDIPYEEMSNFTWGSLYGFVDPKLTLAQTAIQADDPLADDKETVPAGGMEAVSEFDNSELLEGYEEEPLPAFLRRVSPAGSHQHIHRDRAGPLDQRLPVLWIVFYRVRAQ
jgi:hypothetical protein